MRRSEGFTLLEVLVAVSIFALGILAVASMQFTSIRGNAFGNEMTAATFLAQDQLEWLKNQPNDSTALDPTQAPQPINDPNNPIDATGAAGGLYNRSWTVADGPSTGSRVVTVTVNWTAGLGDHTVTLRTTTRGNGE